MDSSFLTVVNVILGLFSAYSFFKIILRFGLPNHPARLTIYIVCFCAAIYFCMKAAVGLGLVPPFAWLRWRTLPLVAGSLALLLQVIGTIGSISVLQQKVLSRLPLIAGLLVFTFFPAYADYLFIASIVVGCGFLSISVGNSRHLARLFLKMGFFLLVFFGLSKMNEYWVFVAGESLLLFAMFYFFLFEEGLAIKALLEEASREQGKTA